VSTLKKSNHKTNLVIEIIEIIIIVFALSWFTKTYLVGFATVQDNGMLPTLGVNNRVLVVKISKINPTLESGDIVVYLDKDNNQKIKRLIGITGDTIEMRNGLTYVNDKPLFEPYAETPLTYQFPKFVVRKDQVFVLNDNRSDQNDSRQVGSIPIDDFIGKAIFCYWPWSNLKGL